MTLAAMDRHDIVLGFLSNLPGGELKTVYDWVSAAPGRFIPAPFICAPDDFELAFLEAEFEAGRLRGLGEVGAQYCGLAIDDPSLADYFAMADRFNVPVVVHSHGTGNPTLSEFRIALGRPTRIEEVVASHPSLHLSIEDADIRSTPTTHTAATTAAILDRSGAWIISPESTGHSQGRRHGLVSAARGSIVVGGNRVARAYSYEVQPSDLLYFANFFPER